MSDASAASKQIAGRFAHGVFRGSGPTAVRTIMRDSLTSSRPSAAERAFRDLLRRCLPSGAIIVRHRGQEQHRIRFQCSGHVVYSPDGSNTRRRERSAVISRPWTKAPASQAGAACVSQQPTLRRADRLTTAHRSHLSPSYPRLPINRCTASLNRWPRSA